MAVIPGIKNTSQIKENLKSNVLNRTGINVFDSDSKAGALIDVLSTQLITSRSEVINAFQQNLISTTGEALDRVGESYGIKRLQPTRAFCHLSDYNFVFFVETGNFGDTNGGLDRALPAGTIVYSDSLSNDNGKVIRYKLSKAVTLTAADTIQYAAIEAEGVGSSYNVGQATIKNHDIANSSGLKCINNYPIINGRDVQDDKSYRYFITNYFATLPIVNDLRAKLSTLSIPGIIDAKIINNYFGVGTVAAIVIGSEFQISNDIVQLAQRYLDGIQLPGVAVSAVAGEKVEFSFTAQIANSRELSANEKLRIKNILFRAARDYLRGRGLAGTISLESMYQYMNSQLSEFSITKYNSLPFKDVVLSRTTGTVFHPGYETLVSDSYLLEDYEFADIASIELEFEV